MPSQSQRDYHALLLDRQLSAHVNRVVRAAHAVVQRPIVLGTDALQQRPVRRESRNERLERLSVSI